MQFNFSYSGFNFAFSVIAPVTDVAVSVELRTTEHVDAESVQLKQWKDLPSSFDQPFSRGMRPVSATSVSINNVVTKLKVSVMF